MTDLLRPWKAGALAALIGMTGMAPAFAKDVKIGVLMPRTGRMPRAVWAYCAGSRW